MFNNAPTCARAYLRACFRVRTRERSDVVAVGQKRVQPNVSTIAGIFLTLLSLYIYLSLTLLVSLSPVGLTTCTFPFRLRVYTRNRDEFTADIRTLPEASENVLRLSLSFSLCLLFPFTLSFSLSKKLHVCVRSYL